MKRWVIADIHGNFLALEELLKKSGFNYEEDKLICLGDTCDGKSQSKECYDELMKIKNLIYVWGNHDYWVSEWLKYGVAPRIWRSQGGDATIASFLKDETLDSTPYIDFFKKAYPYYVEDNKIFMHGGYDWKRPIAQQHTRDIMWDRDLLEHAQLKRSKGEKDFKLGIYDEIYIGHTTTERISLEPVNIGNVWALDQGSGWSGMLSLMDIDTKEFFTAKGEEKGRG